MFLFWDRHLYHVTFQSVGAVGGHQFQRHFVRVAPALLNAPRRFICSSVRGTASFISIETTSNSRSSSPKRIKSSSEHTSTSPSGAQSLSLSFLYHSASSAVYPSMRASVLPPPAQKIFSTCQGPLFFSHAVGYSYGSHLNRQGTTKVQQKGPETANPSGPFIFFRFYTVYFVASLPFCMTRLSIGLMFFSL